MHVMPVVLIGQPSENGLVCGISLRHLFADVLVGRVASIPADAIAFHSEVHHRAHVVAHILAYLVAVVEHHQAVHKLGLSTDESRDVLHHIGLIRFEHKEIFTLADLFTMLPKGIIHNGLSCKLRITSWYDEPYFAGYMNQVGKYIMGNPYDAPFIAEELMDVIFQLLCWAIDNGHVKLD